MAIIPNDISIWHRKVFTVLIIGVILSPTDIFDGVSEDGDGKMYGVVKVVRERDMVKHYGTWMVNHVGF